MNTHLLHTAQWCVLAGLTSTHLSQLRFQVYLNISTVLVRYRRVYLMSAVNPANLSLFSTSASFLDCRCLYYKRRFSINFTSVGPFALTKAASVWLKHTLNPKIAPTNSQSIANGTPRRLYRTLMIKRRNTSICI